MAHTLLPNERNVPPGTPLRLCFQVHEDNLVVLRGLVEADLKECGDIGTQKDDLFLLRFILASRGKVEAAAVCVRKCIAYRKSLIEEIRYVQKHGQTMDYDYVRRFLATGWLDNFGDLNHPVLVVRIGHSNVRAMCNTYPMERLKRELLMSTEVGFQRTGYLTRKNKRLVKMFYILDFTGFSLAGVDRKFMDTQVEVGKMTNPIYPQLVGKAVMINVNMAFRIIYRAVKPLLPRSTIDRQSVCPAAGTSKSTTNIHQCPFVRRMNAVHQIPKFLGSTLETPPQLLEPCDRLKSIVQCKVPSSQGHTILNKEVLAAHCSAEIELQLLTSGSLTLEAMLNDQLLEGPFKLAAKDGLVKRTVALPSPGKLRICATNKSRYNRVIEIALTFAEETHTNERKPA